MTMALTLTREIDYSSEIEMIPEEGFEEGTSESAKIIDEEMADESTDDEPNQKKKLQVALTSTDGLVPDYAVALALAIVPSRELVRSCNLVSRQWHRVLSSKEFWWRKAKSDWYDVYEYMHWRDFASFSLRTHRMLAIRQPFQRNFVRDSWDLSKQNFGRHRWDPRWRLSICQQPNWDQDGYQLEVPPDFLWNDAPKLDPETGKPVDECVAVSIGWFFKRIVIKLADEGLTDELMDDHRRPDIELSELVANRRDCDSQYRMWAKLTPTLDTLHFPSYMTEPARVNFKLWNAEEWRRAEQILSGYAVGMRYLLVECSGTDRTGKYGLKMANFSVKALPTECACTEC